MKITDPKSYWESEDFESPYQMGPQKHRVYMLDLLKEKGVTSLLDVGCGTGPIYQLITDNEEGRWDNIEKYVGADYSRTMIETCKKQFPYGEFKVEDARALSQESSTFGCVLIMHALDHLDNYRAAIKEAARVSRKYVCIILWRGFVSEGVHLNDRNMMGKKEGEAPWEDTYLQEYSKESLEEAFKDAGLIIEAVADGESINSDYSKYNMLYLLKKDEGYEK